MKRELRFFNTTGPCNPDPTSTLDIVLRRWAELVAPKPLIVLFVKFIQFSKGWYLSSFCSTNGRKRSTNHAGGFGLRLWTVRRATV